MVLRWLLMPVLGILFVRSKKRVFAFACRIDWQFENLASRHLASIDFHLIYFN